jgi:CBS domain-containing protein
MQIKDIMSQPVITSPDSATLNDAARLMWEFDCGIVPVVNHDGRLAGVVTDRDICMAAYTQGRPLDAMPADAAMARNVIAVHSEDLVEQAEELMRDNQIRRLPVLDRDGRPVGVVSMNDLARLAARARKNTVDRDVVRTLAGISQPRSAAAVPLPAAAIVRRAG